MAKDRKNYEQKGIVLSPKTIKLLTTAGVLFFIVSKIPGSGENESNNTRTISTENASTTIEIQQKAKSKVGIIESIFGGIIPSKETNSINDSNSDSKQTPSNEDGNEDKKVVSIPVNEKQLAFINKLKDPAIENYHKYKILPSVTIAQAIHESDWGDSGLSAKYHNYFGIKAGTKWTGPIANLKTKEYYDEEIVDGFRVYNNLVESVQDHGKFLYDRSRYKQIFSETTYQGQTQVLEDAGYATATDKNGNKVYADRLIKTIETYNLHLIDEAVV